jgi:predicted Zn-ribbon and HTH transcriptional regulator
MSKAKYLNDVISSFEAEDIVKKLSPLKLEEYCSSESLKLYTLYEKLNMQSHKNSLLGSEDYIMNAFIIEEKIQEVIKNLFVIELFKLKIFPKIKKEVGTNKLSIKAYLCLHFESIIVNLLEKFFYFVTACQTADNYLLDILEYCYHNIVTNLFSNNLVKSINPDKPIKLDNDPLTDLEDKVKDIDYAISIACLSITRFISDHLDQLPFPITNHMLNSKDFPLLLVEILDIKPWEKRDDSTNEVSHIFQDNSWIKIKNDEDYRKYMSSLNKYEAQAWISIYNLFTTQGQKYEITDYRKNIILRLKKHMNQRLYDQIPPLLNLYRALEELSISGGSTNSISSNKSFLVEMVPELFLFNHSNKSDKALDFKVLSENILNNYFIKANIKEEMELISEIYNPQNLDYFMDNPKCGNCGNDASNRCSQCKSEWYCSKECQIIRWKSGHKEFCLKIKEMDKEINLIKERKDK